MQKLREQEVVEEFIEALSNHDWYYDYTDDFSVFERGVRSSIKLGMASGAAVDIYNQYAPDKYKTNTDQRG
jgi:hypothetical protein